MSPVWLLSAPWNVFQDYTQSLRYTISGDLLSATPNELNLITCTRETSEVSLRHFARSSIVSDLQPHLPGTRMTTAFDQYDQQLANHNVTTNQQILTFLVGMISNNIGVKQFAPIIVDLARSQKFRMLLRHLLGRNFDTMRALGEKLLHFAVAGDNFALVKLLIESHVDINLRSNAYGMRLHRSALECAVQCRNLQIVEYLLEQGADGWSEEPDSSSIFDEAMETHNAEIFRLLLNHARQMRGKWPQPSSHILHRALLAGRTEILELLCQHRPELLKMEKEELSYFYEEARRSGYPKIIEILASHVVITPAVDSCGHEGGLAAASLTPDISLVKRLLPAGVNIETGVWCRCPHYNDVCQIHGEDALHKAISWGNETLVRILIDQGANVQEIRGMSTIQKAAMSGGNPRIISMLLLAGVDVDYVGSTISTRSDDSRTALHLAIEYRNIEIAKMLLDAGASLSLNAGSALSNYTWELLWARIFDSASACFVQKLLSDWIGRHHYPLPPKFIVPCIRKLGWGIMNELVGWGIVASYAYAYVHLLHWAISNQDIRMVDETMQLLIADPAAFPRGHVTAALVHATMIGNSKVVQMLLQAGLDPFERISPACTKFFDLIITEDMSAFIESRRHATCTLLQAFLDHQGPTILYDRPIAQQEQICEAYVFALCSGNVYQEHLLTSYGVTRTNINRIMGPNYLNHRLYEEIERAIAWKNYEKAGRLLDLGASPANIEKPNTYVEATALQMLARDDQFCLFKRLLDLGADVHVSPIIFNGATALQYAAINGNFSIVKMCLEAGADVNAAPGDHKGRTAIEGAAEWGRLDMVRYLLEAGAMIRGRTNINYRRTVYRAWVNGHQALVGMIQDWKREQYGEDDCEDSKVIVQTVTRDELVYASEEVRLRYLSKKYA
jgi:ankyrin repeat protein